MKTKTIILAVLCCLFSCNDRKYIENREIDGCEYIVSVNSYGNVVSHKGNCKNPLHYKVIHDTIYVVKVK